MKSSMKLDHINLTVPNLEAAVTFYQDVLHFTVVNRFYKGEKAFVFMQNGDAIYELMENAELTTTIIDHIAYVSEDIVADYNHFLENSPEMIITPLKYLDFFYEHGMDIFFIKGAGNERIEFCQKRNA